MQQGNTPSTQITVPVTRVKEIQQLNKKGKKPEKLLNETHIVEKNSILFTM